MNDVEIKNKTIKYAVLLDLVQKVVSRLPNQNADPQQTAITIFEELKDGMATKNQ